MSFPLTWSKEDEQAGFKLASALRKWLVAQEKPPHVVASALAYELTARLAASAGSQEQAAFILEAWVEVMKQQVAYFGVGENARHP